VRADRVKTGTVADLAEFDGGKFSIGKRNSGSEGSARHVLGALGIDPEKTFSLEYLGYGPSADALQNGTIDGANTPAGAPVSAISRAFAAMGDRIQVLGFTDAQLAQVNKEYDLWTRYVIKAGTYPNQAEDINTIAQPNFLAVRADVSDDDVYLITKTMYENLGFLNNIHAATKAMGIEKAIAGLPMPLHPGAARYYREVGLAIPDRLIAN
jgi:TRAP transporter TAXI family solute receptor